MVDRRRGSQLTLDFSGLFCFTVLVRRHANASVVDPFDTLGRPSWQVGGPFLYWSGPDGRAVY